MKQRARRVRGLNRKIFYRNLRKKLKPEYAESLKYFFEARVDDYEQKVWASGRSGWYEIQAHEHKQGRSEEIRTN